MTACPSVRRFYPGQQADAVLHLWAMLGASLDVEKQGVIDSVVTTAANVHDFTPAAELLHGDEEVVYGGAGYQGIAKRPEMAGKITEFRVAIWPGKRRALLDTPDGRLQDLIETAKAHVRAKVEHPF